MSKISKSTKRRARVKGCIICEQASYLTPQHDPSAFCGLNNKPHCDCSECF